MGIAKCQTSGSNANIRIKTYSKLTEQVNLVPASGISARNSSLRFESVAACLDYRAMPVIIGACNEGTLIHYRLDTYREAGFIPYEISDMSGYKPVLGLGSDKKCHLIAIDNGKVWAASETRPGSGTFDGKRELSLPYPMATGEPVRVMARNLAGQLSVGVVVKHNEVFYGMCYRLDFNDSSAEMNGTMMHQITRDGFDLALLNGKEYAVATSGNSLALCKLATSETSYYLLPEAPEIQDIRWMPWGEKSGRFFALKDDGDGCMYGELTLNGGTAQATWYHRVAEKCRLETASVQNQGIYEAHVLLSGEKTYHALVKDSGGSVLAGTPVAIVSGGALAKFIENRLVKSEFYLVQEDKVSLAQYIIGNTDDYTRMILSLPDPADNSKGVVIAEGYTTEMHLTDLQDAPLSFQSYTVWAKDEIYVETDMGTYRLGPSSRVALKTNAMGVASFVQKATGMATTDLYVTVAGLWSEPYVIRPYESVVKSFLSMTPKTLAEAKTEDGEWVLPEDYRNLEAAGRLLDLVQHLAGMAATGSETRSHGEFSFGNILNAVEEASTTYGDIALGQENSCLVTTGVRVSNELASISFTMAGAPMQFSGRIENASQALCAIESVFSSIGVGIKKVFKWLGFLFNPKDILLVKSAIDFMFTNQIDFLIGKMGRLKNQTMDMLDTVEEKADECLRDFKTIEKTESPFKLAKEKIPERPDLIADISGNTLLQKTIKYADDAKVLIPATLYERLRSETEDLRDILIDYADQKNKTPEFASLQGFFGSVYQSSEGIYSAALNAIIDALRAAVKMVFSGLASCVNAVFDGAAAILRTMLEIAQSPLEIPFVSEVVFYCTGYKPTVLDINTMIVAVPCTWAYKGIFDKAPFSGEAEEKSFEEAIKAALDGRTNVALLLSWKNFVRVAAMIVEAVNWIFNGVSDIKSLEDDPVPRKPEFDGLTIGILIMDFILLAMSIPWIYDEEPGWKEIAPFGFDGFFFFVDLSVSKFLEAFLNRTLPGMVITCIQGILRFVMTIVLLATPEQITPGEFADILQNFCVSITEAIKPMLRIKGSDLQAIPPAADFAMAVFTLFAKVVSIIADKEENDNG
jgi:hypothetical protein